MITIDAKGNHTIDTPSSISIDHVSLSLTCNIIIMKHNNSMYRIIGYSNLSTWRTTSRESQSIPSKKGNASLLLSPFKWYICHQYHVVLWWYDIDSWISCIEIVRSRAVYLQSNPNDIKSWWYISGWFQNLLCYHINTYSIERTTQGEDY